tara:strand:+ start:612 stop:860 length:249 start_codon:yes stop_codon:yes gene_type:complete
MRDRATFEEAMEASQQKGIKFKLEDGTNISIQQNKFAYCNAGKSCEVGVWKDGSEDEMKVFSWMPPERLGSLLVVLSNGGEI